MASRHVYRVKVNIDIVRLVEALAGAGKRYITVDDLAHLLGVSTRSAGKILSRLEYIGAVERHSRRAYRISRLSF